MSRVYLAAPYADKEHMPAIAELLETAGHTITHKWWTIEEDTNGNDRSILRKAAFNDWMGVTDADYMVLINSRKSEGKAVEQGIALQAGIPIIAVGQLGSESKNVFHWLPAFHWVANISEAIRVLEALDGSGFN